MKIFIEGQEIANKNIDNLIPSRFLTELGSGKVKCDFVGYFRETGKEPIFLLPKVFSNEIIAMYDSDNLVREKVNIFIIEQYLALKKYKTKKTELGNLPNDIKEEGEVTYIDVAIALVRFYEKHKYLNQVVKQDIYEKQIRKVKWNNLINKGNYLVSEDAVLFDMFYNERNVTTNNDFLLKLLFREIIEINKVFGITKIDYELPILSNQEYNSFKKKPIKILRALKKRYFRDEFIKLIKLLINYYSVDKAEDGRQKYEYLLSSDFQNVFEAMVDNLISDKKLLEKYKVHKDGKILDHIYEQSDILNSGDVVYVGDSKYYKDKTLIQNTKWKQFTYVNNIQDIIINEMNRGIENKYANVLFDNVFRGYNIIPNFFISGYVEEGLEREEGIFVRKIEEIKPLENYHLKNMLFDRDTLNIFYFEINLKLLIKSYIHGFTTTEQNKIKLFITDTIKEYYNDEYNFYLIDGNKKFVFFKQNYYDYQGKIIVVRNNSIFLALRKEGFEAENKLLLNKVEQSGLMVKKIRL